MLTNNYNDLLVILAFTLNYEDILEVEIKSNFPI